MLNRKKGFTLIELLVVIAIIGVLASVVLASLNTARRKGRDARRLSDIKQLQNALELYYDTNSVYPAAATDAVDPAAVVTPGYIAAVPTDPSGGAYRYGIDAGGTMYCLGANLETSGHAALSADLDNDPLGACAAVDGDDADGCNGEANRYCYDARP